MRKATKGSFKKGHKVPQKWRDKFKIDHLGNTHGFKKGNKIGLGNKSRTGQKQSQEEINKRKALMLVGEKSAVWKGDNAGYGALHDWVIRWKGQPLICEKCGIKNLKQRQNNWANIDHTYRRVLNDYIRLCVPCHRKYDKSRGVKIN
jgi:hypothetical protein